MSEDLPIKNSSTTDHEIKTAGPFRLEGLIGAGGFGSVWMGVREEPYYREAAIKIPLREDFQSATQQTLKMFHAEAQCLAVVNHPNIVQFYESGNLEDGRPFIAQELIEGTPLIQFSRENALSFSERIEFFKEVCAAVAYLHERGILHGDLSPENLIVAEGGGEPRIKLIDFGFARVLGEAELEEAEGNFEWCGTEAYASPGRFNGEFSSYAPTSDVFSLGKILCELIFGFAPKDPAGISLIHQFEQMPRERRAESAGDSGLSERRMKALLSGKLGKLITKAIHSDSESRIADVGEFMTGLQSVTRGPKVELLLPVFLSFGAVAAGAFIFAGNQDPVKTAPENVRVTAIGVSEFYDFRQELQQCKEWFKKGRMQRVVPAAEMLLAEIDQHEFSGGYYEELQTRLHVSSFLAACYTESGDLNRALVIIEENLPLIKSRLDSPDGIPPSVLTKLNSLFAAHFMIRGDVRRYQGKTRLAVADYLRSAEIVDLLSETEGEPFLGWTQLFGIPHIRLADTMLRPGSLLVTSPKSVVAEELPVAPIALDPVVLYDSGFRVIERVGKDDGGYQKAVLKMKMAAVHDDNGRPDLVVNSLQEARELLEDVLSPKSLERRYIDLFLDNEIHPEFTVEEVRSLRLNHRIAEVEWWVLRGNTLMKSNRIAEAVASYEAAEMLAMKVKRNSPEADAIQFYVSDVFVRIARQCVHVAEFREYAVNLFQRGHMNLKNLSVLHPENSSWKERAAYADEIAEGILSANVEPAPGHLPPSGIVRKP